MFSRREAASTDSHNTNVDDALIGDTVEHVIRKSTDELRVRGRSAPVAIRLSNNALSYWTNSVGSLADTDDDCRHIRIEDIVGAEVSTSSSRPCLAVYSYPRQPLRAGMCSSCASNAAVEDGSSNLSRKTPRALRRVVFRTCEAAGEKDTAASTQKLQSWRNAILHTVRGDLERGRTASTEPPRRRMLVLINPVGGSGRAAAIFRKEARPLFQHARIDMTIKRTEHAKHATEICQALEVEEFDSIIVVDTARRSPT